MMERCFIITLQRKLFTLSCLSPGRWHHSCIWRAPWRRPHAACWLPRGGPSSEPCSPRWWRRPSSAAAPWSPAGFCRDEGKCLNQETRHTEGHRAALIPIFSISKVVMNVSGRKQGRYELFHVSSKCLYGKMGISGDNKDRIAIC